MPNLDRFTYGLPDPAEAPVLAYCEACGMEVYEGSEYYELEDGCIHKRCKSRYAEEKGFSEDEVLEMAS